MKDNKSFIKGAILLTAAALFVKVLSAVYRVPFQNIVGDTGFYIYQQVYPFYGLAAGLAVSGFPVILSRLTAEADQKEMRSLHQTAYVTISCIGITIFLLLFFLAGKLSLVMGDVSLKPLIQLSAWFFLAIPYITVRRGAFQGEGNMIPTAASQMTEQTIRVVCILFFSFSMVFSGRTLYEAGIGAVAGSLFGMAASAAVLWYYSKSPKLSFSFSFNGRAAKAILTRGTAICLSALTLVLLQLADSFQLYSGLVASGIPDETAKTWKGIYDRGQPMLQLGVVFAGSIALAIVPLITKSLKENNEMAVVLYSKTALRVSFTLGIAAATGLAAVMIPLNTMLFKTADGSGVLAIFGLSIFFYSIMTTINAIFQGYGNDWIPAAGTVITVLVKWTANALLIPLYGLYGASAATVAALFAGVLFLAAVIRNQNHQSFFTLSFLFKAALAALLMAAVVYGSVQLVLPADAGRIISGITAIGGALLGACLFFIFMVKWNVLNSEELRVLPFGEKIVNWTEAHHKRK